MRISTGILFFLFFLFSSCKTDVPAPARNIWTEKDVEGYWATSNLINASEQAPYFPDAIGIKSFLRFKNTVNGEVDSTYYVKGDTVWTKTLVCFVHDGIHNEGYCFEPVFRIRNATNEKLTLFDLKCKKEINYYNVMSMPEISGEFNSIGLSMPNSGDGVMIDRDSFYVQGQKVMGCSLFERIVRGYALKRTKAKKGTLDSVWKNTLRELFLRVNSEKLYSLRSASLPRDYVVDHKTGEIILVGDPYVFQFWIKSNGVFNLIGNETVFRQAPLAALNSELLRLNTHADVPNGWHKQQMVMPSDNNLWLLDTAAVRRDQEIRNRD